jgi:RNA polymerase sigma factor (sigma-70 family)
METDAQLLRRFGVERSEAAFTELVHRHVGRVYGVALRKVGGDAHLAQDIAQTVFISLARKARRLAGREAIGGWLYQATHLAAIEALRAQSRRQVREWEAHHMNESQGNSIDHAKLTRLLDETLHQLGEADRNAVWLRFFEELSFAQIGERLHSSENAARMRVNRALDKLNGCLARRGITSTAGAISLALANQAFAEVPAGLGGQVVAGGVAALGPSVMPGAGVFFMSNLKLIGGSALLGGLVATSWSIVEWNRGPRDSAASLDPAALKAASDLVRREFVARTLVPAVAAGQPAAAAKAATPAVEQAVRRNAQGIPITSSQMQAKIRGNLMSLKSARNMALKFDGRVPASVAELVGPNGRLARLDAVNGEDYSSLDLSASRFKVTAADGVEVEYEAGPPTPSGPPTRQETDQWEAELAAYIPAPFEPGQGFRIRNEHDAALVALGEAKKRQGWEEGWSSIFRPQKLGALWDAQINHHTEFVKDGKKMRSVVFIHMTITDDGVIQSYKANPPNIVED